MVLATVPALFTADGRRPPGPDRRRGSGKPTDTGRYCRRECAPGCVRWELSEPILEHDHDRGPVTRFFEITALSYINTAFRMLHFQAEVTKCFDT